MHTLLRLFDSSEIRDVISRMLVKATKINCYTLADETVQDACITRLTNLPLSAGQTRVICASLADELVHAPHIAPPQFRYTYLHTFLERHPTKRAGMVSYVIGELLEAVKPLGCTMNNTHEAQVGRLHQKSIKARDAIRTHTATLTPKNTLIKIQDISRGV